jgi:hypothetical protein
MDSENRTSPTHRVTGLTLFALVAMSAAVGTGPAPRAVDEARLEGHVVRAVAAAVAAAARDLMVSEHPTAAVAVLDPCVEVDGAGASRFASCDAVPAHAGLLGERLLDLPPPTC